MDFGPRVLMMEDLGHCNTNDASNSPPYAFPSRDQACEPLPGLAYLKIRMVSLGHSTFAEGGVS